MEAICRTTAIEDLTEKYPRLVGYLVEKGLPCLVCGEPTWGTFEELARRHGRSEHEIDILIEEMNSEVSGRQS